MGSTAIIDMDDASSAQPPSDADLMIYSSYQRAIKILQKKSSYVWQENHRLIKTVAGCTAITLFFGYFAYALYFRYVFT